MFPQRKLSMLVLPFNRPQVCLKSQKDIYKCAKKTQQYPESTTKAFKLICLHYSWMKAHIFLIPKAPQQQTRKKNAQPSNKANRFQQPILWNPVTKPSFIQIDKGQNTAPCVFVRERDWDHTKMNIAYICRFWNCNFKVMLFKGYFIQELTVGAWNMNCRLFWYFESHSKFFIIFFHGQWDLYSEQQDL